MKLITQFGRNRGLQLSIVLTVFPWILEVNASKEEKRACPFSSSTPRRKKTTKSFCKEWASKLAESDKGSYYNQEKWLKDDKASEKPIETTAKSSFTSFLTKGASFLGCEVAKLVTNSRQVHPRRPRDRQSSREKRRDESFKHSSRGNFETQH